MGRLGIRKLVLLAVGLFAAVATSPAHAAFSSAPDRTYVTNGSVRAIVRSGGTVYLGGDFTRIAPGTGAGAELNLASGQPRAGMAEASGGRITAVTGDGAGGWYIGGQFTHVGGLARLGLAHIRPDGTVDPNFNATLGSSTPYPPYVEALYLYGSTLYVGGYFNSIGGQPRNNIAALNLNGTATAWNPDADGDVATIRVYTPLAGLFTYVFVGGYFSSIGGQPRNNIAELDAASGTATSWNPNADSSVYSLVVTGGLKLGNPLRIYAGGDFQNIGGQPRSYIAALDGSGNAVSTWNADADRDVYALALAGPALFAGGYFTSIGGKSHLGFAALEPGSGNVLTWNDDVSQFGYVDALAASGSTLYVGGSFTSFGAQPRDNLSAIDLNTAAMSAWNPSAFGPVSALGTSASSVYAGGDFSAVGGQVRHNLAALDAFTGAPTTWNPDADQAVFALVLSGSTLYAGGYFTKVGGQPRAHLAAIDLPTGQVKPGWHADTDYLVDALAISGSTVYAGGNFGVIGGISRNHIAAVDAATGATKPGWDPNPNGFIRALTVSGPTLYVGGEFHSVLNQPSIGGQIRNYIAALDTTTGVVGSWNPGANFTVDEIVPSGSLVYVGGDFTKIGTNGKTRNHIAALDGAGNANDWDPNADYSVITIAVTPGAVYAGGSFGNIGGQKRRELAALDPVTGKATSWNPSPGTGSTAYAFALTYSGGTLYSGGGFPWMDLGAQEGFASFSTPPVKAASPAISGSAFVGQSLTCSSGSWSGSTARYSFAWLRDGGPVAGATNASYPITLADGGHGLACRVTAVNLAGSGSATSGAMQVPANCFVPKLKGKTLRSARRAISRAHCRLGKVRKRVAKGKPGRVLKQTPKAHTVLPNGAKVNVVLSRKRRR